MSARMQTKVRVKRVALMNIVEGRVRKAENEYKRAIEAYPGKLENWREACATTLDAAAVKARTGKTYEPEYNRVELPERPNKPSEGRELCNLRRMFTTLKIGSEETVLLSQEDADFYFGPCTL